MTTDTTEITRVELTLDAAVFKDLARVASAAATDKGRDALTHVHFTKRGPVLEAVATDSYRLAIATHIGDAGAPGSDGSSDFDILIPAKLMTSIAAAAKKCRHGGQVTMTANGPYLLFQVASSTANIVQGGDAGGSKYPEMRQILDSWKSGELASISFNAEFLAGAADIVPDCKEANSKRRALKPPLTLHLPENSSRPAKFTTSCQLHGVDYLYLLMPVRIS